MLNEHDIADMKPNDIQHGGNHYKQFKGHEPWDVITAWGLGYLDGTALKYISRWRHKGGVEDIDKAIHFLQKLKEQELQVEQPPEAWKDVVKQLEKFNENFFTRNS